MVTHIIDANKRPRTAAWVEVRTLAAGAVACFTLFIFLAQTSVWWPASSPCQLAPGHRRAPITLASVQDPQRPSHPGDVRRVFRPHGSGAPLFVVYGAYRGGSSTFAVVGLGLKPLYSYGAPTFQCFWVPSSDQQPTRSGIAYTMLPDMNYGRVFTVVVVNCTFDEPVGTHHRGGELLLHAYHGDGLGKPPEYIVALVEDEQAYHPSMFEQPYPYDYLYCGSPLFGDLNARRIREWMAYHVRLFGARSHFIFHDAGGMDASVREVLEPWRELGYVTVQDVRQQAEYDGYYYNQFLILNDCLHRTKFKAHWTFFFDVDEYIYVPPERSFHEAMRQFSNFTMLQFNQFRMSDRLCQDNKTQAGSRWGFERLVYRDMDLEDYVKTSSKYAVQARGVYATGVHGSQKEDGHMDGEAAWAWWPKMRYYHYHNTINNQQGDLVCLEVSGVNVTSTSLDGIPYELDTSMTSMGPLVKQFELEHITPTY